MSASSTDELRAEIEKLDAIHPALAELRSQGVRVYRAKQLLQQAIRQTKEALAYAEGALSELREDEPL